MFINHFYHSFKWFESGFFYHIVPFNQWYFSIELSFILILFVVQLKEWLTKIKGCFDVFKSIKPSFNFKIRASRMPVSSSTNTKDAPISKAFFAYCLPLKFELLKPKTFDHPEDFWYPYLHQKNVKKQSKVVQFPSGQIFKVIT